MYVYALEPPYFHNSSILSSSSSSWNAFPVTDEGKNTSYCWANSSSSPSLNHPDCLRPRPYWGKRGIRITRIDFSFLVPYSRIPNPNDPEGKGLKWIELSLETGVWSEEEERQIIIEDISLLSAWWTVNSEQGRVEHHVLKFYSFQAQAPQARY
jgi:hypothetical protein